MVLRRLQSVNFRLKAVKCEWGMTSISYLGYLIDCTGIHPSSNKIEAIRNAPEPRNLKEIQAYLGLLIFI